MKKVDVNQLICPKCEASFPNKKLLSLHLCGSSSQTRVFKPGSKDKYSCKKCSLSFQYKSELIVHRFLKNECPGGRRSTKSSVPVTELVAAQLPEPASTDGKRCHIKDAAFEKEQDGDTLRTGTGTNAHEKSSKHRLSDRLRGVTSDWWNTTSERLGDRDRSKKRRRHSTQGIGFVTEHFTRHNSSRDRETTPPCSPRLTMPESPDMYSKVKKRRASFSSKHCNPDMYSIDKKRHATASCTKPTSHKDNMLDQEDNKICDIPANDSHLPPSREDKFADGECFAYNSILTEDLDMYSVVKRRRTSLESAPSHTDTSVEECRDKVITSQSDHPRSIAQEYSKSDMQLSNLEVKTPAGLHKESIKHTGNNSFALQTSPSVKSVTKLGCPFCFSSRHTYISPWHLQKHMKAKHGPDSKDDKLFSSDEEEDFQKYLTFNPILSSDEDEMLSRSDTSSILPAIQLTPESEDQMTPESEDQLTPERKDQMTHEREDPLTPEGDQLTPESEEQLTPESEEQLTPERKDQLTSKREDHLATESKDQLTPESDDQLTPESEDQLTTESKDQLTPESDDQLTPESEDQLTTESNQLTPESDDQLTPESEDQLTTESDDQLTTESEDQLTTESEDQLTTESEDQLTLTSLKDGPPILSSPVLMESHADKLKGCLQIDDEERQYERSPPDACELEHSVDLQNTSKTGQKASTDVALDSRGRLGAMDSTVSTTTRNSECDLGGEKSVCKSSEDLQSVDKSTHHPHGDVSKRETLGQTVHCCVACDYKNSKSVLVADHILDVHWGKTQRVSKFFIFKPGKKEQSFKFRKDSGSGLFKCPYCPRKSYQKANLKVHIRKHTGEKPLKCLLCSHRASQQEGIVRHIWNVHEDDVLCINMYEQCQEMSTSSQNQGKESDLDEQSTEIEAKSNVKDASSNDHADALGSSFEGVGSSMDESFGATLSGENHEGIFSRMADFFQHIHPSLTEEGFDNLSATNGLDNNGGHNVSTECSGHNESAEKNSHKMSSQITGYKVSSKTSGHKVSSESTGHKMSSETTGHKVSSEITGLKVSFKSTGHKSSSESTGHKASSKSSGHKVSSEITGHEVSSENTGYTYSRSDSEKDMYAKLLESEVFKCPYCGKTFGCAQDVVLHSRKHTGEKPYHCAHCDYKSAHKTAVEDHIKLQHSVSKKISDLFTYETMSVEMKRDVDQDPVTKKYVCLYCWKKCITWCQAKVHGYLHTKPYSCKVCEFKTSRRHSIMVHIECSHQDVMQSLGEDDLTSDESMVTSENAEGCKQDKDFGGESNLREDMQESQIEGSTLVKDVFEFTDETGDVSPIHWKPKRNLTAEKVCNDEQELCSETQELCNDDQELCSNKQELSNDEPEEKVKTKMEIKKKEYWVQCDSCFKWRKLPRKANIADVEGEEKWFCRMNPDQSHNKCSIPEVPYDKNEEAAYSTDGPEKSSRVGVRPRRGRPPKSKLPRKDETPNDGESSDMLSPSGCTSKSRSKPSGLDWCIECGSLSISGFCSGYCIIKARKRAKRLSKDTNSVHHSNMDSKDDHQPENDEANAEAHLRNPKLQGDLDDHKNLHDGDAICTNASQSDLNQSKQHQPEDGKENADIHLKTSKMQGDQDEDKNLSGFYEMCAQAPQSDLNQNKQHQPEDGEAFAGAHLETSQMQAIQGDHKNLHNAHEMCTPTSQTDLNQYKQQSVVEPDVESFLKTSKIDKDANPVDVETCIVETSQKELQQHAHQATDADDLKQQLQSSRIDQVQFNTGTDNIASRTKEDMAIKLNVDYIIEYSKSERAIEGKVRSSGSKQCPYCNKTFQSVSCIVIHTRTHTGEKPFRCLHCNHRSVQHQCMYWHIVSNHWEGAYEILDQMVVRHRVDSQIIADKKRNSSVRRHKCSLCKYKSKSLDQLEEHFHIHSKKPFVCAICSKQFTAIQAVKTHIIRYHSNILQQKVNHKNMLQQRTKELQQAQGKADANTTSDDQEKKDNHEGKGVKGTCDSAMQHVEDLHDTDEDCHNAFNEDEEVTKHTVDHIVTHHLVSSNRLDQKIYHKMANEETDHDAIIQHVASSKDHDKSTCKDTDLCMPIKCNVNPEDCQTLHKIANGETNLDTKGEESLESCKDKYMSMLAMSRKCNVDPVDCLTSDKITDIMADLDTKSCKVVDIQTSSRDTTKEHEEPEESETSPISMEEAIDHSVAIQQSCQDMYIHTSETTKEHLESEESRTSLTVREVEEDIDHSTTIQSANSCKDKETSIINSILEHVESEESETEETDTSPQNMKKVIDHGAAVQYAKSGEDTDTREHVQVEESETVSKGMEEDTAHDTTTQSVKSDKDMDKSATDIRKHVQVVASETCLKNTEEITDHGATIQSGKNMDKSTTVTRKHVQVEESKTSLENLEEVIDHGTTIQAAKSEIGMDKSTIDIRERVQVEQNETCLGNAEEDIDHGSTIQLAKSGENVVESAINIRESVQEEESKTCSKNMEDDMDHDTTIHSANSGKDMDKSTVDIRELVQLGEKETCIKNMEEDIKHGTTLQSAKSAKKSDMDMDKSTVDIREHAQLEESETCSKNMEDGMDHDTEEDINHGYTTIQSVNSGKDMDNSTVDIRELVQLGERETSLKNMEEDIANGIIIQPVESFKDLSRRTQEQAREHVFSEGCEAHPKKVTETAEQDTSKQHGEICKEWDKSTCDINRKHIENFKSEGAPTNADGLASTRNQNKGTGDDSDAMMSSSAKLEVLPTDGVTKPDEKAKDIDFYFVPPGSEEEIILLPSKQSDMFQCNICHTPLGLKQITQNHQCYQVQNGDQPYQCVECSFKTEYYSKMKVHLREEHSVDCPNMPHASEMGEIQPGKSKQSFVNFFTVVGRVHLDDTVNSSCAGCRIVHCQVIEPPAQIGIKPYRCPICETKKSTQPLLTTLQETQTKKCLTLPTENFDLATDEKVGSALCIKETKSQPDDNNHNSEDYHSMTKNKLSKLLEEQGTGQLDSECTESAGWNSDVNDTDEDISDEEMPAYFTTPLIAQPVNLQEYISKLIQFQLSSTEVMLPEWLEKHATSIDSTNGGKLQEDHHGVHRDSLHADVSSKSNIEGHNEGYQSATVGTVARDIVSYQDGNMQIEELDNEKEDQSQMEMEDMQENGPLKIKIEPPSPGEACQPSRQETDSDKIKIEPQSPEKSSGEPCVTAQSEMDSACESRSPTDILDQLVNISCDRMEGEQETEGQQFVTIMNKSSLIAPCQDSRTETEEFSSSSFHNQSPYQNSHVVPDKDLPRYVIADRQQSLTALSTSHSGIRHQESRLQMDEPSQSSLLRPSPDANHNIIIQQQGLPQSQQSKTHTEEPLLRPSPDQSCNVLQYQKLPSQFEAASITTNNSAHLNMGQQQDLHLSQESRTHIEESSSISLRRPSPVQYQDLPPRFRTTFNATNNSAHCGKRRTQREEASNASVPTPSANQSCHVVQQQSPSPSSFETQQTMPLDLSKSTNPQRNTTSAAQKNPPKHINSVSSPVERVADFVYAPSKAEKLMWTEGILQCPVCSEEAQTTFEVMRHMRGKHSGETPFRCCHCLFSSACVKTMLDHIDRLHPASVFELSNLFHICEWQARQGTCNLDLSGMKACRPLCSDAEFYHCTLCGFKTFQLPPMVDHLQVTHKSSSYLELNPHTGHFVCPVCHTYWLDAKDAMTHTCLPAKESSQSFPQTVSMTDLRRRRGYRSSENDRNSSIRFSRSPDQQFPVQPVPTGQWSFPNVSGSSSQSYPHQVPSASVNRPRHPPNSTAYHTWYHPYRPPVQNHNAGYQRRHSTHGMNPGQTGGNQEGGSLNILRSTLTTGPSRTSGDQTYNASAMNPTEHHQRPGYQLNRTVRPGEGRPVADTNLRNPARLEPALTYWTNYAGHYRVQLRPSHVSSPVPNTSGGVYPASSMSFSKPTSTGKKQGKTRHPRSYSASDAEPSSYLTSASNSRRDSMCQQYPSLGNTLLVSPRTDVPNLPPIYPAISGGTVSKPSHNREHSGLPSQERMQTPGDGKEVMPVIIDVMSLNAGVWRRDGNLGGSSSSRDK